jgi:hypothetical protein
MKTAIHSSLVASVVLCLIAVARVLSVSAEHDSFRFKWPWGDTTSAVVTSYPFTGVHTCEDIEEPDGPDGSCTNAFDFVIADDIVRSSTQGVVVGQRNDVTECGDD